MRIHGGRVYRLKLVLWTAVGSIWVSRFDGKFHMFGGTALTKLRSTRCRFAKKVLVALQILTHENSGASEPETIKF